MTSIAPSKKDTANAALEKRLWDAVDTATRVSASPECEATWRGFRRAKDPWSANSGLKSQDCSAPILGRIFLRLAAMRAKSKAESYVPGQINHLLTHDLSH